MRRFRLCVSLIVWFSTFSSQCFMYSLFIISVWSVRNDGTVGFILVRGLVLMCSLVCEKVEQDRFQLLLSFFPSPFISVCLQITLCINKNTHFHVFLGIKIVERQVSIWNVSPLLSSSISTDLVRSRDHMITDLRLLWFIVKIIVLRPQAILDLLFCS